MIDWLKSKVPPFGKWPTTQLTWANAILWFNATGFAHVFLDYDLSWEWVALLGASLGVAVTQFGVKRVTQFTPEQQARATVIKNGGGFGNGDD